MNKVFLIGRLTKDPELRYTSSNIPSVTFTLAVDRIFTNQNGEREADFINIVVWRKQAENVKNYLTKGSQVAIDGRLQTRSYDAQDGTKCYVTEVAAENVQFLDRKKEEVALPEVRDYITRKVQEEPDPFLEMSKQVEAEFTDEEGNELPF